MDGHEDEVFVFGDVVAIPEANSLQKVAIGVHIGGYGVESCENVVDGRCCYL